MTTPPHLAIRRFAHQIAPVHKRKHAHNHRSQAFDFRRAPGFRLAGASEGAWQNISIGSGRLSALFLGLVKTE